MSQGAGLWNGLLGFFPNSALWAELKSWGRALTKARGHLPPAVQQEAWALFPAGIAGLAMSRVLCLGRL